MQKRSVLDDINLKYGPVGTIGRYILAAERTVRQHDIHLRVTTLDEIVAVQKANQDSWKTFLPLFDPQFHNTDCPSFAMVGETSQGQVVATLASRFFDWSDSNFTREAEGLRLTYTDPEKHALPGEACLVTACAGKGIEGRVAYSGAAWYHPSKRGLGLFEIVPRISRSVAHSLWNTDCTVSISVETLVKKKVVHRVGYANLEYGVVFRNSRMGDVSLALVWSKTNEMLADIEDRLSMLDLALADQTNTDTSRSVVGVR
jgi:hypothetical protein